MESCRDRRISPDMLIGTLPHGFFDNIQYGADYYSGHMVFEAPGQHKITDLGTVVPEVFQDDRGITVRGEIATPLGKVIKTWRFWNNSDFFDLSYRFLWADCPVGSLRFGYFTLNPDVFEPTSLFFSTHNGGSDLEHFSAKPNGISHFSPVSALVSAHQAVALTNGEISLGDKKCRLSISFDPTQAALVAGILCVPIDDRYLFRVCFSGTETDDTSVRVTSRSFWNDREISFRIRLDHTPS